MLGVILKYEPSNSVHLLMHYATFLALLALVKSFLEAAMDDI
jgi:hypothetical protein